MTTPIKATDIVAARAATRAAQDNAADPERSAWVNANAGTGKTYVLTRRVLRLLLAGTPPERILCLTFTNAAAAEMSKRVFGELSKWVTKDRDELIAHLTDMTGQAPSEDQIALARTLFTRAIETPGGLKVQTIHAFAERLLQRFPLEAGVSAGFKVLDDDNGRELKGRAIDGTLTAATNGQDAKLKDALSCIIALAADSTFDELLERAISKRDWIDALIRLRDDDRDDELTVAEAFLRKTFRVGADVTVQGLDAKRLAVLSSTELKELRDHLQTGTSTDLRGAAELVIAASNAGGMARLDALKGFFLTKAGEPRKSLMNKPLRSARPDLDARAVTAQADFVDFTAQLDALRLVEATLALYRLSSDVLQRYSDAKRASGALDFDDLIRMTASLLSQPDTADWVLYKLDGGLDHILVDEAQDTSPTQWQIVEALSREFFSGSGARDVQRTVFAVGDEKQSIYSFQGAAPEMFDRMGKRFAKLATDADTILQRIPLNLSFRTVQPILDAVDNVFANPSRTPGLTAANDVIQHLAHRAGHAGRIEIWQPETVDKSDPKSPWLPLDDSTETAPANRLAERIAATIDRWLKEPEILPSANRPIRAGDIMILVRKRHPFAIPMVAALKRRRIPVAGSDRMMLNAQIAVQDLIVLGDFLTLPEDDLALATVLKGPIFDLDDDDLLGFAAERKTASLWKALLAAAKTNHRLQPAAETLRRWRARADFLPPFEFYSNILDRDGVRRKLLIRLGPEASDPIDEFLDAALAFDDDQPPSLTGFLAHLREAEREIKRDMDLGRNEVRVMTVHGAKGLEAPIVFLPDTCTASTGPQGGARLMSLDPDNMFGGQHEPFVWAIKGSSSIDVIQNAKAVEEAAASEERNRLLYVAMTRARDRLYVAGFTTKDTLPSDCWHSLVTAGLGASQQPIDLGYGTVGWRIETAQTAESDAGSEETSSETASQPLPDFARRRAASEPQLSVPLAPSRLEPYGADEEGEPLIRGSGDPGLVVDQLSPTDIADARRFLRGNLTHNLLQHLPRIAADKRRDTAAAFIARRGAALTATAQKNIVDETLAVLNAPVFATIFSSDSRAEVPISATIPRPHGKGPALKLNGQIDRLAVTDDEVLIIDYKTNRPPPTELAYVAKAYIHQLAAYTLALRAIYPGKPVRCGLLWTYAPRLMEIPETVINAAIEELWNLDLGSLDAW